MAEQIRIETLTKDDAAEVVSHLSKFFCLDEPILCHLKLGVDKNFLEGCVAMIDGGVSIKAINADGKIVGIFLSEIKRKLVNLCDHFKCNKCIH